MKHRIGSTVLLLLLSLWVAGAAGAMEPLPVVQPDGRYAEADPAARYHPTPPGDRARFRQLLNANIQKNPRNVAALSQRAYLFMEGGDTRRARRDFDRALEVAEPGSLNERNVYWSRGWASYELGEHTAAFADWQRAIALHGGRPFWAAYSMALLYWTNGQSDLALQWFDAADEDWRTDADVTRNIRRWSAPQQVRMQALFAAWQQRRQAVGHGAAAQ
jgi:tetratricopeptide (TPR) repeat protein